MTTHLSRSDHVAERPEPFVAARCFGVLSLTVGGHQVERWQAGKARGLFVLLLANRGAVVRKEKLLDTLWPDARGAATSLKVAVHALRRILDPGPHHGHTAARVACTDAGYVLQGSDLWVDVEALGALCGEGEAAVVAGDRDGARRCYGQAMQLYRGEYLEQETDEWVEEYRQEHRARALRALEVLRTDAAVDGEDLVMAAHWCRRTLEVDPYHEPSYRMLMWTHGRRGERGMVRSWYELCRNRLHDLDVDPQPTTQVVYDRAIRGDRTALPA